MDVGSRKGQMVMPQGRRLTNRDDVELLRYIESFRKVNRISPTVREIQDELGLKSKSPAAYRINRLIELGYLERLDGISRALFPTKKGLTTIREHERKVEELTETMKATPNVWEVS